VEQIAQQFQVFESSLLDLVAPAGSPKYLGAYQSSNQLMNALAHLVAQDGQYSRLLACDETGALQVNSDYLWGSAENIRVAVETMAAWGLSGLAADVEAISEWDMATLASDVGDIAEGLADVLALLTDVWNTSAHAIRTTT